MEKDFSYEIDQYFSALKSAIDHISRSELSKFLNILLDALERKASIYIMGNGGSAATASHFAADFNKGLSYGKARRFRMICLNDNVPTLTAYANDVSYEDIFVEQLRNFLEKKDVVIAISGSGNSRNVLKAVEYANETGACTVGIAGYDGGKLKKIAKYHVIVPMNDMQITEDLHMVFDHLAYSVLQKVLAAEHS